MNLDLRSKPTYYWVVIYTSKQTAREDGYSEMADKMVDLAKQQPSLIEM